MKTMKIFRKTTFGFACRLMMLTVLLLVEGASVGMYAESIPWAKYENGTLTFFYGEKNHWALTSIILVQTSQVGLQTKRIHLLQRLCSTSRSRIHVLNHAQYGLSIVVI